MTVRDRIFEKIADMNMTQKEFSERTGIPQTTVSDWRKKRTNPTAPMKVLQRAEDKVAKEMTAAVVGAATEKMVVGAMGGI